ncbi:MAG TPA: hypothetical protein VJ898_03725 [Natrialbaceae archaeon]|nr:hypothetical protein [Natrialbaceae archaeon]
MVEIVCEHCGHEQTVTVSDLDPECEHCGSKKLRGKGFLIGRRGHSPFGIPAREKPLSPPGSLNARLPRGYV